MLRRRAHATISVVLRVTVLELPASWGDPRAVLATVETELVRGPVADLVLLPEAALTGYVSADGDFDLARFAEPFDGPTARALSELARRRNVHLVAPLVLAEGGRCYNAMLGFDRHGRPSFTYRKRHPWIPETWATPGDAPPPVVDVEGVRVTIAVCFDVHFLSEESSSTLDAADLLLFPSAWVEERDSRRTMLAELARRHRIAVANANWGPGIVRVPGQGDSSVLDANGRVLARVSRDAPLRVLRADAMLELAGDASRP
jgi:predicted amidohydrolase